MGVPQYLHPQQQDWRHMRFVFTPCCTLPKEQGTAGLAGTVYVGG